MKTTAILTSMRLVTINQSKSGYETQLELVSFRRNEMKSILRIYGQMVAQGRWKDYGISCMRDQAIFSIFRRTAEHPLYMIIKCPSLARKKGIYSIIGMDGQILKRGQNLDIVLIFFKKKLLRCLS